MLNLGILGACANVFKGHLKMIANHSAYYSNKTI